MEQPAQPVQERCQDPLSGRASDRVTEPALHKLEIPVAEPSPGEIPQPARCLGELELLQVGGHSRDRLIEAVEDPSVLDRKRGKLDRGRLVALKVHHRKAGGVPELVGEVAALLEPLRGVDGPAVGELQLLDRNPEILSLRRAGGQRVTEGVGTVDLDDVDRVEAVACRFLTSLRP